MIIERGLKLLLSRQWKTAFVMYATCRSHGNWINIVSKLFRALFWGGALETRRVVVMETRTTNFLLIC